MLASSSCSTLSQSLDELKKTCAVYLWQQRARSSSSLKRQSGFGHTRKSLNPLSKPYYALYLVTVSPLPSQILQVPSCYPPGHYSVYLHACTPAPMLHAAAGALGTSCQ